MGLARRHWLVARWARPARKAWQLQTVTTTVCVDIDIVLLNCVRWLLCRSATLLSYSMAHTAVRISSDLTAVKATLVNGTRRRVHRWLKLQSCATVLHSTVGRTLCATRVGKLRTPPPPCCSWQCCPSSARASPRPPERPTSCTWAPMICYSYSQRTAPRHPQRALFFNSLLALRPVF